MKIVIGLDSGHAFEAEGDLDRFAERLKAASDTEHLRVTLHGTGTSVYVRKEAVEYVTDGEPL